MKRDSSGFCCHYLTMCRHPVDCEDCSEECCNWEAPLDEEWIHVDIRHRHFSEGEPTVDVVVKVLC